MARQALPRCSGQTAQSSGSLASPTAKALLEVQGSIETRIFRWLGSPCLFMSRISPIEVQSRSMTVAARAVAWMKAFEHALFPVATRCESLSLRNVTSILLRLVKRRLSELTGLPRDLHAEGRALRPFRSIPRGHPCRSSVSIGGASLHISSARGFITRIHGVRGGI